MDRDAISVDARRAEAEGGERKVQHLVQPTGIEAHITMNHVNQPEEMLSDRFLVSILEHAHDAIIATNDDGVLISWNKGAEALFGLPKAAAIGRPVEEVAGGEWPEQLPRLIAQIRRTGSAEGHLELICLRTDGKVISVELWMSPVPDDAGNPIGFSVVLRDIARRKRAERALRESEDRYRTVVETASDGIITIDAKSNILFFNPAAEQIFGYRADEITGRKITVLMPEVLGNRHTMSLQEYLETGQKHMPWTGIELTGLHRSGQEIPLEISFGEVYLEGRRLFTGIVRDVSVRKQAEETLQRNKNRLSLAVEVTGLGIYEHAVPLDEHTYHSDRWAEILGYQLDELPAPEDRLPWVIEQVHPEDRPKIEAAYTAFVEGRTPGYVVELRMRHKSGSWHWIRGYSKAMARNESGKVTRVLGVMEDITERKRSEERFRLAVEAAPNAMVMVDPGGRIVLANQQAEVLFGYGREQLLGMAIENLVPERFRGAHPDLRAEYFEAPVARPMGAGRDLFARRSDGSEFPVEIGLTPIQMPEGTFVLGAIVDTTVRKQLEDTLRQANQELEHRVAQRTKELIDANEKLERSNIELTRFAYIASHDLQTPLRSISGFVQLLQQDYHDQLDEQAHHWIDRVVYNTKRMKIQIEDLLAYSRVDSRARPFTEVELGLAFLDAVDSLSASILDANANVTCEDLPAVHGDRSQLVQLLQNLLENGIKYNTSARPAVHVAAEQNQDEWIVRVVDNGIGIDGRYGDQIFELFRRLHTQQAYPGTGIGLAVCRRIVHRHGGRIWVESDPGKGSVFYFSIPIERSAP